MSVAPKSVKASQIESNSVSRAFSYMFLFEGICWAHRFGYASYIWWVMRYQYTPYITHTNTRQQQAQTFCKHREECCSCQNNSWLATSILWCQKSSSFQHKVTRRKSKVLRVLSVEHALSRRIYQCLIESSLQSFNHAMSTYTVLERNENFSLYSRRL